MFLISSIVIRLPSPLLTKNQLRMLATIFADLGQVSAAGLVIPFFMGSYELIKGMIGLTSTLGLWILALLLSRERLWIA